MTTWADFQTQAPELAAKVAARLAAHKHHVLATLRADGSPRVSGTEVHRHGDVLTLGSMPGAAKARDLQRDGRFALHTNPGEHTMEGGDSKLSGTAREVRDASELAAFREHAEQIPDGPFHLFVLDLLEVVHTAVSDGGDHLVIECWRPDAGVSTVARY